MKTIPVVTEASARTKGCFQEVAPHLPHQVADELATLGKALADPTRVQLLHMLKEATEPVCVCDFTAAFDLGQPTVSHHLAKLREAGLVTSHKRGIWAFYALATSISPAARRVLELIP